MNAETSTGTAAGAKTSAAGSARNEQGWYVLTAGPSPGSRRPPRLRRVVAQVALAAVVVLVLVGIVGSVISRRTAQSQSVHEVAELTNVIAESVVSPALTDAMATSPAAAAAGLDKLVRDHVLSGTLVRVKLWTPQGEIVYSDESRLDGARFELGEDERAALVRSADPRRGQRSHRTGEQVRARAGQVARGVPPGVDAGRQGPAVRDLLQVHGRQRPRDPVVARLRGNHVEQRRRRRPAALPIGVDVVAPCPPGTRGTRSRPATIDGRIAGRTPAYRRDAARRRGAGTRGRVVCGRRRRRGRLRARRGRPRRTAARCRRHRTYRDRWHALAARRHLSPELAERRSRAGAARSGRRHVRARSACRHRRGRRRRGTARRRAAAGAVSASLRSACATRFGTPTRVQ